MNKQKELKAIVYQLGELAHQLEEALDVGAEINYENYCLKREVERYKVQLQNENKSIFYDEQEQGLINDAWEDLITK